MVHDALNRWRRLLEPELEQCVMPVRWRDLLAMDASRLRVHEAAYSVLVLLDVDVAGLPVRTVLCACGRLDEIRGMAQAVEIEARREGITRVVWMGRRGWLKAMPGWVERAVVAERKLT